MSWIERCLREPNTQWYEMFQLMCGKIDKLFTFGNEWCQLLSERLSNKFWKNILQDWSGLCKIKSPSNNAEIMESPIWFNGNICPKEKSFPDWYNNGIYVVGDLINSNGTMVNFDTLKARYNCNFNILNYYTVKAKVLPFTYRVENDFHFERPVAPLHLKIFFQIHQDCKRVYKTLLRDKHEEPLCQNIQLPTIKSAINVFKKTTLYGSSTEYSSKS